MVRRKATSATADLVIRLAGEGGEGVISLGEVLTAFLFARGWEVMAFKTFPAEIRGGPAWYELRVSRRPAATTGDRPDILLAMNVDALAAHGSAVPPGGLVLADDEGSDAVAVTTGAELVRLPLGRVAREAAGFPQGKNMACLGALARLLDLPRREVAHYIQVRFAGKGASVVEKNLNCFRLGYAAMDAAMPRGGEIPLEGRRHPEDRKLVTGNEAVALGALAAGCRFFAGYPITPATSIMEFLVAALPRLGGHALQMEDEMAAMAAVLGASFGGVPAMTATSGPGLSLMTELLGLASMAEIPAVVVDVQRGGPSTGLPTKTEQADLDLAIHGMHGEGPRVVLAAADVADCFGLTIEAFRIAERWQVPVVLLSDLHLAFTTSPVHPDRLLGERVPRRLRPPPGTTPFLRYDPTDDGVSPAPFPGDPGMRFVATGLEHEPDGSPSYDPAVHEVMMAKRARKMDGIAGGESGTIVHRAGGDAAVISWGSTHGAVEEAATRLAAGGMSVDRLHLRRLWPFPAEEVAAFCRERRAVAVVELNRRGQAADLVDEAAGMRARRVTSGGGLPFRPGDLAARLAEELA